jgi:polysaccharide chain length determinant protein (PEP-CTERM system associated)
MLPGKQFSIGDILPILLRRRWYLIVPPFVGGFLALIVSSVLPNRYVSETLIQIVPQGVPEEYVRSTVTTEIDTRLKSIKEQIMSRTKLAGLINELDLYPQERQTIAVDDLLGRLESSIGVQIAPPVRTARGYGAPNSFRLRFTYHDAKTAQRVTARLADWFIAENSRMRGQQAESTNEFLDSQLVDARKRLEEQEKKVEEFNNRHSGSLPSQVQANMQAITGAQAQLQSLISSLETDRASKLMTDRLYADAQADLRRLADAPPLVTPAGGTSEATLAAASPRQQLESARQQLAQLELRLTAEHPDIRNMQRRIAELEQKVASAPAATEGGPTARQLSPEEVTRRDRVSTLRAQLDGLNRNIAFKEAEERRIRGVVSDYQNRLGAVPGLESEFARLTRDQATLQANYNSLLQRSENSKVATNLEHFQVGEQFHVLDAASLPSRPESPQRLLVNLGGVIFGLILGAALAGLLEFVDTTFRNETDVVSAVSLPVLAVVPNRLTKADLRHARRRRRFAAMAAAAGIALCAGVGIALQLWRYVL